MHCTSSFPSDTFQLTGHLQELVWSSRTQKQTDRQSGFTQNCPRSRHLDQSLPRISTFTTEQAVGGFGHREQITYILLQDSEGSDGSHDNSMPPSY